LNEENKYNEIRDLLKSLPRISSSEDFEIKLRHKINLLDANEEFAQHNEKVFKTKESRGFELFGKPVPFWLIPSVSFGVVLIIVYSFWLFGGGSTNLNKNIQSGTDSGNNIVTSPQEQLKTNTEAQYDNKEKNIAMDETKPDEVKPDNNLFPPDARPDEIPKMVQPVDRISVEEETMAFPPLPSVNEDKMKSDGFIREQKPKAKEPEMMKEEQTGEKKEKKNVNAIKTEKGIDFKDSNKNDLLKDKTGIMDEKKQKKDGIKSKIDSLKKSLEINK